MKLRELLQKIIEIQQKIHATEPLICGGVARDKYMGDLKKISDLDITTGDKSIHYLADEFAGSFKKKFNISKKVAPDGHSTIYVGNLKMDFSSNFIVPNIETYLYKIGIKAPTNMQKELFSRDFTCNTLLLPFSLKEVIDPTHRGFKDIDLKVIRTNLDPSITLLAHKNRVIRSIYLACKLGFGIDNSIVEFVKSRPETVKNSTPKSLKEKLEAAFKWDGDKASYYLTKMNLWEQIPIIDSVYPYYMKRKG